VSKNPEAGDSPQRGHSWLLFAGCAISIGFIILITRQVHWDTFLSSIAGANIIYFGIGLLFELAGFYFTALRWHVIVYPSTNLSRNDAFDFLMISNLANLVLPARLGDLGKAALVGKFKNVSTVQMLGIVFLERLYDVVMLLILSVGMSFLIELPDGVPVAISVLSIAVILAIFVVVGLGRTNGRFLNICNKFFSFLPGKISGFLFSIVSNLSIGVSAIKYKRQFFGAFFYSLVSWFLVGIAYCFFTSAFHLAVPWYAGFFVMLLVNLGGIIPSSPGSIGVFHYLAILALSVWISDKGVALGFAVVAHGCNLLLIMLVGLWSLSRKGLSFRKDLS
jgi:uncharacterized protein (TIRG00374 family)